MTTFARTPPSSSSTGRAGAAGAMAQVAAAARARRQADTQRAGRESSRETSRGTSRETSRAAPSARDQRKSDEAIVRAARSTSDQFHGRAADKPGAAGALKAEGHTFQGMSGKPGPHELHPKVAKALDNVPAHQRSDTHGACVEPKVISQALDAYLDPSGGTVAVVRTSDNAVIPPCGSCSSVLGQFGVRPVMPR